MRPLDVGTTPDIAPTETTVTSLLLEAFLTCPLKCRLLSEGNNPVGTEYSTWADAREKSYQIKGILKSTVQEASSGIASHDPAQWKHESWRYAIGETVRAQGWEAKIMLIHRIPQAQATSGFVPIRFVANNKLSTSAKIIAAFEAISIAKVLGTKTGFAKIVHGEKSATISVNAGALSRSVHKKVLQVSSLLSSPCPPDTIINRHCAVCGFRDRCRKDAIVKDDLSLLSNLTEKERVKYRGKGIFTVSQLAYTFRPRRRHKRLADRPERWDSRQPV